MHAHQPTTKNVTLRDAIQESLTTKTNLDLPFLAPSSFEITATLEPDSGFVAIRLIAWIDWAEESTRFADLSLRDTKSLVTDEFIESILPLVKASGLSIDDSGPDDFGCWCFSSFVFLDTDLDSTVSRVFNFATKIGQREHLI